MRPSAIVPANAVMHSLCCILWLLFDGRDWRNAAEYLEFLFQWLQQDVMIWVSEVRWAPTRSAQSRQEPSKGPTDICRDWCVPGAREGVRPTRWAWCRPDVEHCALKATAR